MPLNYDQLPTAQAPEVQHPRLITTPPKTIPAPPDTPARKRFLLTLIFLGEILFGLLLIAGIFVLLNYFNIISLSSSFPFLSSLPHKARPIPSTTLMNSNDLYNKTASQQQLELYIAQSLSKDFTVASPSAFFGQTNHIFQKSWTTSTIPVLATLAYKPFTSTIEFKGVQVGPFASDQVYKDASSSAAVLAQKYFLLPSVQLQWQCTTDTTDGSWNCLSQTSLNGDKQLYGVSKTSSAAPAQQNLFLITCILPKNSPLFNSSSCLVAYNQL